MQKRIRILLSVFSVVLILLDPKTAASGAQDGLQLCIVTIIPTLFPLFFLTAVLTDSISGLRIKRFHKLFQFLGLPASSEMSFFLSLIGGYPVGAATIRTLYDNDCIDRTASCRLMGFYNLAGPSFIFGFSAALFGSSKAAWLIWGIQIASAVIVAAILPRRETTYIPKAQAHKHRTLPKILLDSIRNIATVCGWIILFRIIIAYADKYLLHSVNTDTSVLLTGLLELANGTVALHSVQNEAIRFVLFNAFLSIGGLCVWMQIFSVGHGIISPIFFIGKSLHLMLVLFFSVLLQRLFHFPGSSSIPFLPPLLIGFLIISLETFILNGKKRVVTKQYLLYNVKNNK